MGYKIADSDYNWLMNKRAEFEKYFVERAKKEILGYDENADKATIAPWCQPWMWTENYNINKPEEYFEWLKKGLENVIDEEFYYHTGNNFDKDQMEFEF